MQGALSSRVRMEDRGVFGANLGLELVIKSTTLIQAGYSPQLAKPLLGNRHSLTIASFQHSRSVGHLVLGKAAFFGEFMSTFRGMFS